MGHHEQIGQAFGACRQLGKLRVHLYSPIRVPCSQLLGGLSIGNTANSPQAEQR